MTDRRAVPDDAALPGLGDLFPETGAPSFITEGAKQLTGQDLDPLSAQVSYLRYFPGRRCVVQWTFPAPDGEVIISGELYSKQRRWQSNAPGLEIEGRNLYLQAFPHDDALPGIKTAVSEDWMARELAPHLGVPASEIKSTAVSYKSWRRCVIEYEARGEGAKPRLYGKIFRDERGADLLRRLNAFEAGLKERGAVWRVPQTVLYDSDAWLLLQAELVGGVSLSDVIKVAPGDAAVTESLLTSVRQAAEGLTALQSIEIDDLENFGPQEAYAALQKDVESVRRVDEAAANELAERLEPLEKVFSRTLPEQMTLAHGAFRHSHVYRLPEGLGLLDLDNLRLEGANSDAGYFLAYLALTGAGRPRVRPVLEECGRVFHDAWRKSPSYDPVWLGFHLTATLLKWAVRGFYSLDYDWRESMDAMLQVADQTRRQTKRLQTMKPVNDPLLAVAASRERLRELTDEAVPQLWPGSTVESMRDIDTAYTPGQQCVLHGTVERVDGATTTYSTLVYTFMPPGKLAGVAGDAKGLHLNVEGQDCLIEAFPNDYELPGLARAHDLDHVAALLRSQGVALDGLENGTAMQTLRYRPHERCVVKYTLPDEGPDRRLIAKVYDNGETAAEVWSTLTTLRNQLDGDDLVVRPLAADLENALVFMAFIEGTSLGVMMEETTDLDEMTVLTGISAASLARLHSLSFEHERVKTFESELKKLRASAAGATTTAPALAQGVEEALRDIEAAAKGRVENVTPSLIHGGFKPTQMLIKDGRATIVDFDGSCLGDPAMDVGRFMAKLRSDSFLLPRAHLSELDIEFLAQYRALATRDIGERAQVYQALALVRMASRRFQTSFKAFAGGRLDKSFALLREAHAALSRL